MSEIKFQFDPVRGVLTHPPEGPATLQIMAKVVHLDLEYPNPEAKKAFEDMLEDLIGAHLNAMAGEISMVCRATLKGDPELGMSAIMATTSAMQRGVMGVEKTLSQQLAGPKIETTGVMPEGGE